MAEFAPGQRWINDAQLHRGLGTVLHADFRTVTIEFPSTEETFVYAKESVPLTRVRFEPGDQILTRDGVSLQVEETLEQEALLVYHARDEGGTLHQVTENHLSNRLQFNRPTERLFNAQVDRDPWFLLRYRTRLQMATMASDPLRGLIGGRVSLIPHQLYIAHEVANRYAPRVLLADEVGLGKTIEAGMIIHHQLVTERADRVLIVVPESLIHQWLVEMLRRFNLHFTILDAERVQSQTLDEDSKDEGDTQAASGENPFLGAQLALCSLEFLCSDPAVYKQCCAGEWDLLALDEAHHLEWSEEEPGFEYQLVEHLAQTIPGILLLTATPEQLGRSGHFARLRLLDPHRFPDYQEFMAEEQGYQPVAAAVDAILSSGDGVDPISLAEVQRRLGEGFTADLELLNRHSADSASRDGARERILAALVDRHGTGRVLFRNTRAAVQGFPEREVHSYPLALPAAYARVLLALASNELSEMQLLLCPELLFQAMSDAPDWTEVDPRVTMLANILRAQRAEKVLVIAASRDTALDLAEWLRIERGINAAVFHEDMSLMERDRTASWFADPDDGAQVMVCSEIGSEGRNFQFAHHLVLFDLPLNPDLLEQRIGRLDRIGQTQTIHLHVLYLENSAQEVMYHWYHEGLHAFTHTCPVGPAIFVRVRDQITRVLHDPDLPYQAVVTRSAALYRELTAALQQGRDRLLEYNSCHPDQAEQLYQLALQQDRSVTLQHYLEAVFDCFGADYEIKSAGCYSIHPGSHMELPLSSLPDEGMTVTYDRAVALGFEDVHFLTWDHPMVIGAMDVLLGGELGNTSVIAVPVQGVGRGTLFLESIFVLESASSTAIRSNRYLVPTTLRILIDQMGTTYGQLPGHDSWEVPGKHLERGLVRKILAARKPLLRKMFAASERKAQQQAPALLRRAVADGESVIQREIRRLEALQAVNPNVRPEEIEPYYRQLEDLTARLESASLRVDALRVIVAA